MIWIPIAECPEEWKDGRRVLLDDPIFKNRLVDISRVLRVLDSSYGIAGTGEGDGRLKVPLFDFFYGPEIGIFNGEKWVHKEDGGSFFPQPSHIMPLPAGPED